MRRTVKASIAALALVPALGLAMAMPAGADWEVQINAGLNNCGVIVDANNNIPTDNGNVGRCFYYAVPDPDSYLYAQELSGVGKTTSRVYCNDPLELGAPLAVVTDLAGDNPNDTTAPFTPWSAVQYNNGTGGPCHLKVTLCGNPTPTSTKGMGWVSWVPTGEVFAGAATHCP